MNLPQRSRTNRVRIHVQFRQTVSTQFSLKHTLDRRPFQPGGLVFQGMQCFGYFLRQEVLAIESHHLPDLDDTALELAQLVHQEFRLAG